MTPNPLNYEAAPRKKVRASMTLALAVSVLANVILAAAVARVRRTVVVMRPTKPPAPRVSTPTAPARAFPQPRIDIGPWANAAGKPSHGTSETFLLTPTKYVAKAGPVYFDDQSESIPAYYCIEVDEPSASGEGSKIVFERDIPTSDLPVGILQAPIQKIVTYDAPSRTVFFQVGEQRFIYKLPDP